MMIENLLLFKEDTLIMKYIATLYRTVLNILPQEAIRHEYALTCYLGLQNLLNSVKGHYHEWHPSMEKEATEILNVSQFCIKFFASLNKNIFLQKLWEENKMRINVLKKVGKKEIEELSETKNQGWRKSYRQDGSQPLLSFNFFLISFLNY